MKKSIFKTFIMILFISFSFIFIGNVEALSYGKITSSTGVNLRSGPGSNYERLGTLKYNDSILILDTTPVKSSSDCEDGWIKLNYNGKYAYMCNTHATTSEITINTTAAVNIRNGAGSNYDIYQTVSKNKQLILDSSTKYQGEGCPDGWYRLNYGSSKDRYICSTYATNYLKESNAIVTNLSGANLRAKASSNSSKIVTLRYGQGLSLAQSAKVKGTGCSSGYYKVNYLGNIRYICSSLLEVSNNNYVVNNLKGLNVRASALATATKVGNLSYAKAVAVTSAQHYNKSSSCTEGWYKINLNGTTRYVCGNYLTKTDNLTFTTTSVNVRNGSGSNYSIYTTLAKNKPLILLSTEKYQGKGCTDGWYKISLNGSEKYVCSTYTEFAQSAQKSEAEIYINPEDSNFTKYINHLKEKYNFVVADSYDSGKLSFQNNKVSGLLLQNNNINKDKYPNDKYFFAYVLEIPNATENTKITTQVMGKNETLAWADFYEQGISEGKTPAIAVLVPVTKEGLKNNSTLTITVDLDGTGNKYAATPYKIDLSGIKLQENSQVILNDIESDISSNDLNKFKNWGYTLTGNNKHYSMTGSGNKYQVTGKVESQYLTENTFNPEAKDGYFFLFNIKKPTELTTVPNGVEVTITEGAQSKTYTKEYFNDKGVFTNLYKLNDSCKEDCKIKITVDWDGNGNQYLKSQEIEIDYQSLVFEKSSLFTVEEVTKEEESNYDDKGWFKDEKGYSLKVEPGDSPSDYKISGVLPVLENDDWADRKEPFTSTSKLYYLGLALKLTNIPENYSETSSNVSIKFSNDKENKYYKKIFSSDYNKIYLLKALTTGDTGKKFQITVDFDGDNQDQYAPYTVTIDYSKLVFQQMTSLNTKDVKATIPEGSDKEAFKSEYGYEFKDNLSVAREKDTFKISGKIHEQEINPGVFKETESTNFYIPYNINPTGAIKGKATVTRPINQGQSEATSVINDEYGLSVLFSINPEKVATCKDTPDNCKFTFTVDLDGPENKYAPKDFVIDYSGVELIKYVTATFKGYNGNEQKVKVYPGETVSKDKVKDPVYDEYHQFSKWMIENDEFTFGTTKINENKDINATWTALVNKYITAKVEEISQNENYAVSMKKDATDTIEIDAHKPKVAISNVKETLKTLFTNISELKGVGKINVSLEQKSGTIESKDGIDEVLTTLLDSVNTLDDLKNKTITISLEEESNSSITLDSKSYKINFISDFYVVTNEATLNKAISENAKYIIVEKDFSVNNTVEVDSYKRGITIKSDDTTRKISYKDENGTIFNVNGSITFEGINLGTAKNAIKVNSTASVTLTNVNLTGSKEGAVVVESNGTLKGSDLTYSGEKYENPLVKAKNGASVTVNRSDDVLKATTVEEVIKYQKPDKESTNDIYIGDVKQTKAGYEYKHYYLSDDVANRWIKITYSNNRAVMGIPKHYTLYYDKEDPQAYAPEPEQIDYLNYRKTNNIIYNLSGWSGTDNKFYEKGKVPVPTKDVAYTSVVTEEYLDHVYKATSEQDLRDNLSKDQYTTFIIKDVIELQKELEITRDGLIITGAESASDDVLGGFTGKIKVSGNNVLLEDLKITGKSAGDKHLVEITGNNFKSSMVNYTIEDEDSSYDSILYFDTAEEKLDNGINTTIYYNDFHMKNVSTAIEFNKKVYGSPEKVTITNVGSSIVGNDFYDEGNAATFINLKDVEDNTTLPIRQTELILKNSESYFIKLDAHANKEMFYIANLWLSKSEIESPKAKIEVDTTVSNDASGVIIEYPKGSDPARFQISYNNQNPAQGKEVVLREVQA